MGGRTSGCVAASVSHAGQRHRRLGHAAAEVAGPDRRLGGAAQILLTHARPGIGRAADDEAAQNGVDHFTNPFFTSESRTPR